MQRGLAFYRLRDAAGRTAVKRMGCVIGQDTIEDVRAHAASCYPHWTVETVEFEIVDPRRLRDDEDDQVASETDRGDGDQSLSPERVAARIVEACQSPEQLPHLHRLKVEVLRQAAAKWPGNMRSRIAAGTGVAVRTIHMLIGSAYRKRD